MDEVKEVNETIEEATVTADNVTPQDDSKPLVNGFKNKTIVLPLAILQRRIERHENMVQAAFENAQKQTTQQVQYAFQYLSQVATTVNEVNNELKAMCRLMGITDEKLAETVTTIKAEEALAAEIAEDLKANRSTVDRAAADGDVVKISYTGSVDGKEFQGGKAENYHLTLGSKRFIPGFEEQLIGTKAGEAKNVIVKFPEAYGNKELAGKEATFVTIIHAVKEVKKEETKAE